MKTVLKFISEKYGCDLSDVVTIDIPPKTHEDLHDNLSDEFKEQVKEQRIAESKRLISPKP